MTNARTAAVQRHARLHPACAKDAHLARAADVCNRCSPHGPVVLAKTLDMESHSQASRWMNAEAPSVFSRAIECVERLSRGAATSPFPFISELRLVALGNGLKERDDHWLIRRWHELQQREATAEAEENLTAARRVQHDRASRAAYRAALKNEADLQLELVAIDAELEERDIDPADFTADGFRRIR